MCIRDSIKGWCSASGKFRSDDIKIGSLLAYVGSSSSASSRSFTACLLDTSRCV